MPYIKVGIVVGVLCMGVSAAGQGAQATVLEDIFTSADFSGEVLIARGDTVVYEQAFGTVAPEGPVAHRVGAL